MEKWEIEFSTDLFDLWGSFGCVSWLYFSQTCLLLIFFFFRISDIYICSPFKCKCFKVGNLRVSIPDIWCRPHSLPPSTHPLSLFSYSCIGSNKWLLFKYGSWVVIWRCGSYPPSLIWTQASASSSTWVSERAGRKGLFSKHSWSLTFSKQPRGGASLRE